MTPAQKRVFDVIKDFWETNGCSPTYRILAQLLGAKSFSAIHGQVRNLAAEGWITVRPGRARTIRVVEKKEQHSCASE